MLKLFYNGKIFCMDDVNTVVEAILINDNKIEMVGQHVDILNYINDKYDEPATSYNLAGKVMLPGFIDTHTHFYELAKTKIAVDLSSATNLDEVRDILIDYKKKMPKDLEWIGGSGWNKNIYPSLEGFDRYFLDDIFPDIPVSLESKDFHSKWCNSLALERANINKDTLDPEGGFLGRFPDGEPNGFTHEKAWELIDNVKPSYPVPISLKAIRETIEDCYKMGLVSVHVMEDEEKFNLYQEIVEIGTKFRFCWHFPNNMIDEMIVRGVTSYTGDEFLKIGGQKIFMDGALGSQTALMYEPYTGTENLGTAIYGEEELYRLIEKAAVKGIASSIHAIGDKCCHQVIFAIAKAKEINPELRHRIEHLQCVRPEEYTILKENNIYVAVQPIHMRYDIPTIKKLWLNVEEYSYSFQDLIDNGIKTGYGSDAPVEIINPFQGIYAAISRRFLNDPTEEQWRPEQTVSVMDAIRAYTHWAAIGSSSEDVRGSLKEGYLADLIVIDDFTDQPDEFWLSAKSYLTMVDGHIVYKDEEFKG
jgi:predicted amidohydrolase YtcJ